MRALLVCLALFAACTACASSDTQPSDVPFSERVAGWYQLQPGQLRDDPALARFVPPRQIPTRLHLDTARLQGWEPLQSDSLPLYAVRTDPDPKEGRSVFTYWSQTGIGSDTIHIGHPLPLGGASLRLWLRGRDLAGEITAFTDAIPPDGVAETTAPVIARKVDCAARSSRPNNRLRWMRGRACFQPRQ